MSALTYTPQDLVELGDLTPAMRNEVDRWQREFRNITRPVTKALESIAARLGVSYQTARLKYYAWRASQGDWRTLINRTKTQSTDREAITDEFIQWFKALCEKNQRKNRPAYRVFARMWLAGEKVPGLSEDLSRRILPAGCSYRNLNRLVKDEFAKIAMRQGLSKAVAQLGPKTFTTRAGLWPMSHVMFDDLWHDNFVVFKGKVVRVLEFDAIDVLSGCKIAWGTKPRFQRQDGTFDGLKESFMRMLLASMLYNDGYNAARGTTFMAEHGTAAIREWLEQLLYDRTGGQIRVSRSGITGEQQAVAGMFAGQGKGNPRFKSPLESLRNLIHNELGALPGQTGKDVDNRPESLHGTLKHTTDLLKAIAVLAKERPDRIDKIKLPLMQYHAEFLPVLRDVYQRINLRDWHELEGWTECGFVELQYRLSPDSDQWIKSADILALPATTQQLLATLAAQDPRYITERRLSPWEVHTRNRPQLTRIPAYVVAEILGDDFAKERQTDGKYFIVEDDEISPSEMIFETRITAPDGAESELKADTYKTFLNPFDPSMLFVHNAKGIHLGIAKRVQRDCRADAEAIKRQHGRNAKRLAETLKPIRARHADITANASAAAKLNNDLITGAPVTTEEKQHARALRNFNAPIEDLAAPVTEPEQATITEPTDDFSAEGLL